MNKMNVTSLLSAAPADDSMANNYHDQTQHRMDTSRSANDQLRLPMRSSRTPWDADGYSLPNLTHNPKDNGQSRLYNNGDGSDPNMVMVSPKGSPKHHKFSDSRGSMSSTYTTLSSSNSTHSRISSLSTVSEYQPLSAYGSDCTVTEHRGLSGNENGGMSCPTVVEIPPQSPRDVGSENDIVMGSVDYGRSPSNAVMMRNRIGGSARYVVTSFCDQNVYTFFAWVHTQPPVSLYTCALR